MWFLSLFFFVNDTATNENDTYVHTLSLPDALPICRVFGASIAGRHAGDLLQPWVLAVGQGLKIGAVANMIAPYPTLGEASKRAAGSRSEEHTSELQSLMRISYALYCLKKKTTIESVSTLKRIS